MRGGNRNRTLFSVQGFTLIELVTVIGVIVILLGLLLPAINGAKMSAMKAKSRAQFSQWILAVEGFCHEYGYYPFLDGNGDTLFAINTGSNRTTFEQVLNGKETVLNRRGIRFYALTDDELVDPHADHSLIRDVFGNTELYLLIDGDRDGRIQVGGYDIRGSVEVVALGNRDLGFPLITTWDE